MSVEEKAAKLAEEAATELVEVLPEPVANIVPYDQAWPTTRKPPTSQRSRKCTPPQNGQPCATATVGSTFSTLTLIS